MSTLKTTNLQNADASSANIVLGQGSGGGATVTGVTTVTTLKASTGTFTGDVDIADSIIHTGDTDTKIRFPSTDTITAETGGTERFRITSAGQLQATGAADVRLTLGSSGTAGTNDSVHVRADSANLLFMNGSGGVTKFEQNGTERLQITAAGIIQCGTSGTLKAEINNAVSGHQFISQCSDNNNGFEIYQQHGSTATRNTLAVYDNRGGSGAKQLAFAVRGDGLTVHQGAICMNSETAAANQLDDYEEGSWTPLIHDAAGSNISVTGNTGNYTKIGNLVYVSLEMQFDETGSKNGAAMYVYQLPFSPNGNYKASGDWWYDGGGTTVDKTGGGVYVMQTDSKMLLKQCVNGNAQPSDDYLRWNDVSNGRYIYLSAFYRV